MAVRGVGTTSTEPTSESASAQSSGVKKRAKKSVAKKSVAKKSVAKKSVTQTGAKSVKKQSVKKKNVKKKSAKKKSAKKAGGKQSAKQAGGKQQGGKTRAKQPGGRRLLRALEELRWAETVPESWSETLRQGLRASDTDVVGQALAVFEKLGAAAGSLRDELPALIQQGEWLWQIGDVLAALPPAALGPEFAAMLACAAASTSELVGLAKVLANSLERDPDPEQLAAWLASLTGPGPTPLLVVLYLRAPALRERASEALAGRVAGLTTEPRHHLSGDHYAAFAWAELHPEDVRPGLVAHLRGVIEHGFHVELWLTRAASWPTLGPCLEAALRSVTRIGESADRAMVARLLARRGAEVVAALNRVLDEPTGDAYHREVLVREVAPMLALDDETRARVTMLAG